MRFRHKGAIQRAQQVLEEYGVRAPEHIRLEDIAFDKGLAVVERALDGCDARIVMLGNRSSGVISVRRDADAGRKRFSLAHELGHFCMHPGLARCSADDLSTWHKDGSRESEANAFAGELLIPSKLVNKYCDVDDVSFHQPRTIANAFNASITASAIRFVDLCAVPCSLIAVDAESRCLKWSVSNDAFRPRLVEWGSQLDPGAMAAHCLSKGIQHAAPEVVGTHVWLDNPAGLPDGVEILEDAFVLGSYGVSLSLVWLEGWHDDDDDDD